MCHRRFATSITLSPLTLTVSLTMSASKHVLDDMPPPQHHLSCKKRGIGGQNPTPTTHPLTSVSIVPLLPTHLSTWVRVWWCDCQMVTWRGVNRASTKKNCHEKKCGDEVGVRAVSPYSPLPILQCLNEVPSRIRYDAWGMEKWVIAFDDFIHTV